jgi:hypothetical protein
MRNLLAFIGGAVIVFVGLGWYLGWYQIDRGSASPGHSRLQIDINREKITEDTQKGIDRAKETFDNALDKNKSAPPPAPPVPPVPAADPKEAGPAHFIFGPAPR